VVVFYHKRHESRVREFEVQLFQKYEFRALGEAKHFLGVGIIRDRQAQKLWLIQDAYIDKLADKFHVVLTGKPPKTPLPATPLVKNEATATPDQTYGYQQKVGSANYAGIITRPDISKAVSKLSEFLQNPSKDHVSAAQQLLHYLLSTRNLAVEYSAEIQGKYHFVTSSDSSFADDTTTRASSYGYCFSLFGGVIHYKAVKGKTVTTSSTEAELLALSLAGKEFIWWKRFFDHVGLDLQENSTIFCDNRQTLRLLKMETPKLQTALKHVDIHQSWLRQEVQNQRINVEWVPTKDMVADGFTKLLAPPQHAEFIRQLNLVDITNRL
jgi:hypothetical protein